MYTIGEFAKLSKVSPRMLRHYDKIGLFKPSAMGENGYRYYRDEDIYKISDIKRLRRYELSLEDIDKIVRKNDSEYTKQMLKQKVEQLQQTAKGYNYLIMEIEKQIRTLRESDTILNSATSFDILTGYREGFMALCQRRKTNEDHIDNLIEELFSVIDRSWDLAATGTHMTIFHQEYNIYDPDNTDIEVCIPVNGEFNQEPYYTRMVEGGLYISTIFMGSYDLMGNAYVALLRWVKENDYRIVGPTLERYYRDCRETNSQDEYITEICVPVNYG